MAHFSKIGLNGQVLSTLVVDNNSILNASGFEDESVGQNFLENLNGWPAEMWIKTSYNTKEGKYYNSDGSEGDQSKAFRGNFGVKKYIWDESNNVFWPPKPYDSWTKDFSNFTWKAPIVYPTKTFAPFSIRTKYNEKINFPNLYWDENLYNSNSSKGWRFNNYDNTYVWNKDTLEWEIDS
jgi:hypothetical protein